MLVMLLATDYIVISNVSICTQFSMQLVPDNAVLASVI